MKPGWDDAPEWAVWLAMDHAGWAWFEFRPDYISGSWGAEGRIEALDEMPTPEFTGSGRLSAWNE